MVSEHINVDIEAHVDVWWFRSCVKMSRIN